MADNAGGGVPWRDSMRPVRFYAFDARLLVLLVAWVFFPSWWTTAVVVGAAIGFRIAEGRGYRLRAAMRALRVWSAGERRAVFAQRAHRFTDFG